MYKYLSLYLRAPAAFEVGQLQVTITIFFFGVFNVH